MAAPQNETAAARLIRAGELLIEAGYSWDAPGHDPKSRRQLHDDVETAANDARSVVRGRGFA